MKRPSIQAQPGCNSPSLGDIQSLNMLSPFLWLLFLFFSYPCPQKRLRLMVWAEPTHAAQPPTGVTCHCFQVQTFKSAMWDWMTGWCQPSRGSQSLSPALQEDTCVLPVTEGYISDSKMMIFLINILSIYYVKLDTCKGVKLLSLWNYLLLRLEITNGKEQHSAKLYYCELYETAINMSRTTSPTCCDLSLGALPWPEL